MKHNKFIIAVTTVILMMAVATPQVKAQINKTDNFLCAWGALGYANLMHNIPYTSSIGGPGALIGVGYEVKHKNFIFNIGAEFDYKNSSATRQDFLAEVDMIDTEGENFVYGYNFSKFHDNYNVGYVNVPVRLGGRFKSFYFLLGAKVGFNLFSFSNTWAHIHTTGTYDWSIVPFENQPDHFWLDKDLKGKNQFKMGMNVAATFEMGWSLRPSNKRAKYYYRLGFFADYGVLSVNLNEDQGNVIGIPKGGDTDVTDVKLNGALCSNQAKDVSINPLMVGARFTVLFHVGGKRACNCYQPYETSWGAANARGYKNTHHISEGKKNNPKTSRAKAAGNGGKTPKVPNPRKMIRK